MKKCNNCINYSPPCGWETGSSSGGCSNRTVMELYSKKSEKLGDGYLMFPVERNDNDFPNKDGNCKYYKRKFLNFWAEK